MYESRAAKPRFNKGDYSFLIAFARQLDRALSERPDELEDTLGLLAGAMEYVFAEFDSETGAGGGVADDGSDDDDDSPTGVQDEVESDVADGTLRRRTRNGQSRVVGGTLAGTRPVRSGIKVPLAKPTVDGARAPSSSTKKKVKRGKR